MRRNSNLNTLTPTYSGETPDDLDEAKQGWLAQFTQRKREIEDVKANLLESLEPLLPKLQIEQEAAKTQHTRVVGLIEDLSTEITDGKWQEKINGYKTKLLHIAQTPNASLANKSSLSRLTTDIAKDQALISANPNQDELTKINLEQIDTLIKYLSNANALLVLNTEKAEEIKTAIDEGSSKCDKQLEEIQNSIDKITGKCGELTHVATYQRDLQGEFKKLSK